MQRLQVTEHGMKSHQVPGSSSALFEFARVLVRFDHVASFVVNADHSFM
jgi:hypothetical protein